MKHLVIKRLEKSEDGTFGVLLCEGKVICLTLEDPDHNNEAYVSCIPEGTYSCVKVTSPRFGETFMVQGVPNRSHVLFHAGNTKDDTQGCILLGASYGTVNGKRGIVGSGKTLQDFLTMMKFEYLFDLTIAYY